MRPALAAFLALALSPSFSRGQELRPVRDWSGGSEDLVTEPFPIRGTAWRIDWETREGAPASYLVITIRRESGVPVRTVTATGASSGSERVVTGPGTYTLEISGVDAEWSVAVSEETGSGRGLSAPPPPVQACSGRGTVGGQVFVETGVDFGKDARAWSLGGGYDAEGLLTVDFSVILTDVDDPGADLYGVGAGVLVEATSTPLDICPAFGFSYQRNEELDLPESFDLDLWTVSAGIALGIPVVAGENVTVLPFAAPAIVALHGAGSLALAGEEIESSDTEVGFGATGGLFFSVSRIYGGVSVTATTIDETDPMFGLGVGVVF